MEDFTLKIRKWDLKPEIDKTFQELGQYYEPKVLGEWAKKAMPKQFNDRKPVGKKTAIT
jgi:hypothetical protein